MSAVLHRCCWHVPGTPPGAPGHPAYVHARQGYGRVDDALHEYRVLYLASDPEAAVAEAFGDFVVWSPELLAPPPFLPDAVRALVTYELDARLCDLDDPVVLVERKLRPSQVVTRDRAVTQAWAREIFDTGEYDGVSWWSYRDPRWSVSGVWNHREARVTGVAPLADVRDPRIVAAAEVLCRQIVR